MKYELRFPIFERDDYKCYICGNKVKAGSKKKRKGFPLATLDHIIPRSLGGEDDEYNLKTCCKKCNERKGSKIRKEHYFLLQQFIILIMLKGVL